METNKVILQRSAKILLAVFLFTNGYFGMVSAQNSGSGAGYQHYIMPGSEEQLWNVLIDIDNTNANAAAGMHSVISVTATTNNTTIYYDHWENGYAFDWNDPVTTADETVVLQAGDVYYFESSSIPIAPRGVATYYDGMDMVFTAGGPVMINRSSWPQNASVSSLFGFSVEVYPSKGWNHTYTIPWGEDLASGPTAYQDFEQSFILVQALEDNTTVTIKDKFGATLATSPLLGKGNVYTYAHNDGGTQVIGSGGTGSGGSIQVQFITGGTSKGSFQCDGFTMVPDDFWHNEYIEVVGSFPGRETQTYLYNPGLSPITVDYETTTISGSIVIPAKSTLSFTDGAGTDQPVGSAVFFSSADLFWGITYIDSESSTYDWGYSLVPADLLKDNYVSGWAPGTLNKTANGSPLFVTTLAASTTVFVDYSPIDGTLVSYPLTRLGVLKLNDPDFDNSGTQIFSQDILAAVWGEDPTVAGGGANYLDMGATIIPMVNDFLNLSLTVTKEAADDEVYGIPGQYAEFTIEIKSYDYQLNTLEVVDEMPAGWAYVPGSTVITLPDASTLNNDPLIAGQTLTWDDAIFPALDLNETVTVVFVAVTTTSLPAGIPSVNNVSAIATKIIGGHTQTFTATGVEYVDILAPAEVYGHLYLDTNGNGSQDPGEPDLPNVDVIVTDDNGDSFTVTTDANGDWSIDVIPGNTTANVDETDPDYPGGSQQTEGTDPTVVTAVAGASTDGGTDGYYYPGTLSGHLYIDLDGNGSQDPGEPDLANVDVIITDANGNNQTISTDVNGDWTVTVPPGNTTADIDETDPDYPTGYLQTEGSDPTVTLVIANTINDGGTDGFYTPVQIDLGVVKTVYNAVPDAGESSVFTITLTNYSATEVATGVVVSDVLHANFVYQSHSASSGMYNDLTAEWNVASIAPLGIETLTITVQVNGSADNTAEITGADQLDPNPANNSSMVSVTVSGSSGGGGGGLESDGDLAGLIALRQHQRLKEGNAKNFESPDLMVKFSEELVNVGIIRSAALEKSQSNMINFLPESGPFGSKAYLSTPEDLIRISNASEVVSIDFYGEDHKRYGAILALATENGDVYNHTKLICDRLSGASLEQSLLVNILDKPFILTKLVQQNGEIDYAVSFIAWSNGDGLSIDSRWQNSAYQTDPSAGIMNFQVWSLTLQSTIDLVADILTRMSTTGQLTFLNSDTPEIPEVRVISGSYTQGLIRLQIDNHVGADQITLTGSLSRTEQDSREGFAYTTILDPSLAKQEISLPLGVLYDVGFTMTTPISDIADQLYFADGSWGLDFEEGGAVAREFSVAPVATPYSVNEMALDRAVVFSGSVRNYVSLFRSLRAGSQPVDLYGFNALTFDARGTDNVTVTLTRKSISGWDKQYRCQVQLTPEYQSFQIDFDKLSSTINETGFVPGDVVSVVFSVSGTGIAFKEVDIEVRNLKFVQTDSEQSDLYANNFNLSLYPNPVGDLLQLSFELPEHKLALIEIIDITGKKVHAEILKNTTEGFNQRLLNLRDVQPGHYMVLLNIDGAVITRKLVRE